MKCKGYTPQVWQKALHNSISNLLKEEKRKTRHIFSVLSPRQCGKSLAIENELLRFSINLTGTTSIVLSPTLSLARKIFKDIQKAVQKSGIIQNANASLLNIELVNGSTILFRSAEQRESLRGYTVDGVLIIDEAAYVTDEIWDIIRPCTNVAKAPIILTSTPRLKQGFFYNSYMMGLDDNIENYHSFNFSDYDLSEFLSDEMKNEYRKVMSNQQYTTEILGQFLDGQGMLFTNIDAALVKNYGKPTPKLFVGIDWSSGVEKDSTVLTILNENLEYVDYLRFNDRDTTKSVELISKTLSKYNKTNLFIYSENNGVGKPLTDLLKKALPTHNIIPFTTTNKSKADQVSLLQVALEQEKIKIIDDKQIKLELSAYEGKYNPQTANISYNAPYGFNDDTVMSLMLAMQCFKDKTMAGTAIRFA